jgi:hypothetical protein
MDILTRARKLERRLTRSIHAAVGELVGASATAPLEIIHEVLDRAEQQVEQAGRGRRVFPYTRVKLLLVAAPRDRVYRARFAAVAEGPPSLEERLHARLEAAGCRAPGVKIEVAFVARQGPGWPAPDFHVEFTRDDAHVPPAPSYEQAAPSIAVAVVRGKAGRRRYTFTGGRIDIGRRAEVLDAKQRLVRTNHVAFDEEGPDVNRSVSRRHAHVEYEPVARAYRLLDDRSAHGTNIVRAGRTIPVPPGSRGVRLQDGDEIQLGEASLRVKFGTQHRAPSTEHPARSTQHPARSTP